MTQPIAKIPHCFQRRCTALLTLLFMGNASIPDTLAKEGINEGEGDTASRQTGEASGVHTGLADEYRDELLRYRSFSARLNNINNDDYPYNGFSIQLDRAGTAHLQSSCGSSDEFPRSGPTNTSNGLLTDWNQKLTYLRRDKGWTRLTLTEAENLWGKPRKHERRDRYFFTFDAFGFVGHERNLFHIDLQPASDGKIRAYRVRGIGVTKPNWVTEDSYSPLKKRAL